MLIVLLVIAICVFIIGWFLGMTLCDEGPGCTCIVLSIFAIIGILIFMCCFSNTILEGRVIDQKIEMYQEENQAIEDDIDILVSNFMEHEQKVMWAAEGGSPVTLVNLYPDLKSDALVQEQIRIYTENNAKIKELKEDKIDVSKAKWWLYFGK